MARLNSAKQRITDYLKSIGKDAAEIREVFVELDAADADLDKLADAVSKNSQWVDWYNQITPALQEIVSERDTLKQRVQKLEAAGLKFEDAQAAAQITMNQQPNNPNFNPDEFRSNLVKATNATIKDAAKYTIRHYNKFKEELDIDAVEKLMGEKNLPFDVAYGLYVQPKEEEARAQEIKDKIAQGIKEGMQAELSKQGIRRTRKRTDDVDPAPLDKPAPADNDLKEAFLRDLEAETTH